MIDMYTDTLYNAERIIRLTAASGRDSYGLLEFQADMIESHREIIEELQ